MPHHAPSLFNPALWSKAVGDARLLLVALVVLMFGFTWIAIWITTLVDLPDYVKFLPAIKLDIEKLVGLPLSQLATTKGRISLTYVDAVILSVAATWAITRGSDAVSGEIGRGTMEMLLAQPVSRVALLTVHAFVTTAGAAAISLACWLSTCAAICYFFPDEPIALTEFLPGVANQFALIFFLSAASTLVSSFDNYRWRTIGIMGAFYMVQMVIKIVARSSPQFDWLRAFTCLGAFEPHILIMNPDRALSLLARYAGTLLSLGVLCYVLAGVVFSRRDLPAPL